MYSISPSDAQALGDSTSTKQGVILLFEPALKSKRSQPCIFCGATIRTQNFKGKAVCSTCLEHVPALFIHKRFHQV